MRYAETALLALLFSMAGAFLFSRRLQKAISRPIRHLAEVALRVSAKGDYSIRVHRKSKDELGTLYAEFNNMLAQIQEAKRQYQEVQEELELRVEERTAALSQSNIELSREIVERKKAEMELEETHQRLVETARMAGMAEIATGVLHNVGNVLNSINISTLLLQETLEKSRVGDLAKVAAMIEDHREDLAEFLTNDPKGQALTQFIRMLSDRLTADQQHLLEEAGNLHEKVEHIKGVVSMQQSYAGVGGVIETTCFSELVEDALRMDAASFEKYGIKVQRKYSALPDLLIDRQKVLQIIVNLVTNAKDSLMASDREDRTLTVAVGQAEEMDQAVLHVTDNGLGIAQQNLTKIFSHGFTTKKHGHGFGLHASANAAREMGGRLSATSPGLGEGATFTLRLPLEPVRSDLRPVLVGTRSS